MLAPDGSGVEVHEDLRPLSWLIGRWVGVGTGQSIVAGQAVATDTNP